MIQPDGVAARTPRERPLGEVRLFASLTSVDQLDLGGSAERLMRAGVDGLHIDVADGHFVPFLIHAPAVVRALRSRTSALLDAHMMVEDPEAYLQDLAESGADRVAFHVEATRYPWRVTSLARRFGLEVGIALNLITPVVTLEALSGSIDYVHLLAADHDFAGDRALESMAIRVRSVRQIAPPHVRIEVDGGVTKDNACDLVAAGADDVVVGRGISSAPEWTVAVSAIRREIEQGLAQRDRGRAP